MSASKSLSPAPASEPARAEDVLRRRARAGRGHTVSSESATGAMASPTTCRACRYEARARDRSPDRVDEEPAEPEDEQPVERPAEERPDGDVQPVEVPVVEQPPGKRRREHARDPGEDDDRHDRLLPRFGGLVESSRSAANVPRGR